RERVDAPERAHVERGLGLAEIVGRFIAAHERPVAQHRLERIDGLDEARILRVDEADLGHEKDARIEVLAAEALDEGLPAFAPRLLEDLRPDRVGALAPGRLVRRPT